MKTKKMAGNVVHLTSRLVSQILEEHRGKMSGFNLRRRPRISYFEPEEPNLDEYIFCDRCGDYVFEYCSIHGPLLVIPDDKVPAKTGFPSFVPRAALTIPHVFLHLAPSIIPGAGLGVFSTLTLPRGVRFGPYRGQRSYHVDSMYCWQIYDRERRPAHVLDAADANKSNWLRYVNCSRHWREQNLVAFQYQGQLYYRTIKVVPRFTELMVYYGSEFAHSLRIDLRRYNFPAGYAQKLGAPLPKKPRLEINKEKYEQEKPPAITANETDDTATEENVSETVISKASVDFKTINPGKDKKLTETLNNEAPNTITKKTPTKTHKNFKCNDCRIRFDNKPLLIQHIEIHNKNKSELNHNCNECEYTTVTRETLDKHLKLHDRQRQHVCRTCGFRFKTNGVLQNHIKNCHTVNKKYTCEICDKFKSNDLRNFENHLRVHSGVKPFSCSQCQYKCARQDALKVHLRTHTGEKPLSCPQCQYKCALQSHLKVHLRTYTGEKPFSCPQCQYKCTKRSYLKLHILKKHSKGQ